MPSWIGRFLQTLFLILCALFLIGPFLYLYGSIFSSSAFDNLQPDRPTDLERLRLMWWSTLRITFLATFAATALGTLVAFAIHRSRGVYRKLLEAIFPIPLLLPPVVIAISWTHLLGKNGMVTIAWRSVTGFHELPISIYSEWGSAFILGSCWYPLVTMSTLVGLRALGARIDGPGHLFAGGIRRTWHITLPLLFPYISAGSLFVSWLVIGDFDIPSVFLQRSGYPLEIYTAFQGNPNVALALKRSLPLLKFSICILLLRQFFILRRPATTVGDTWQARASASTPTLHAQHFFYTAMLILFITILLPVFSLIHQAGSLKTFQSALHTAQDQILNTFHMAWKAAFLMLIVGAPYAWLLNKSKGWRHLLLSIIAIIPLAIPGTIQGIAWTKTLLATAPGREILTWPSIVSIANTARFFPFAVFLLSAVFNGLNKGHFDAARVSGANWATRTFRIGLPLVYPGLVAVFAIGFALSAGELSSSIMLNPIGHQTLPVRISSLLHFGKDELLASLCLVQIFIGLIPYLIVALLLERTLEVRFE